jgi:hypothetical protein
VFIGGAITHAVNGDVENTEAATTDAVIADAVVADAVVTDAVVADASSLSFTDTVIASSVNEV